VSALLVFEMLDDADANTILRVLKAQELDLARPESETARARIFRSKSEPYFLNELVRHFQNHN